MDFENKTVESEPGLFGVTQTKSFDDLEFDRYQENALDTLEQVRGLLDTGLESGEFTQEEYDALSKEVELTEKDLLPNEDFLQGLGNVRDAIFSADTADKIGESLGGIPEALGSYLSELPDKTIKALMNPVDFIEATGREVSELLLDEAPRGVMQLFQDLSAVYSNQSGSKLKTDILPDDWKTGTFAKDLKGFRKAQPGARDAANIAIFAAPGLAAESAIGKATLGWNGIARNAAKVTGISAQAGLEAGLISDPEGDSADDRLSGRMEAALNTALLAAGIEGGLLTVQRVLKGKISDNLGDGMSLDEADIKARKELIKEVEQSGRDVVAGKKKMASEINDGLDAIFGKERTGKLKETNSFEITQPREVINDRRKEILRRIKKAQTQVKRSVEETSIGMRKAKSEAANEISGEFELPKSSVERHLDDVADSLDNPDLTFMDTFYAHLGGLLGLNRFKDATPRLDRLYDSYSTMFSANKRFNISANGMANKIYKIFGEKLGEKNIQKIADKYLNSGMYRAWKEGLDVELTTKELKAFQELDRLDTRYNKNYNLPLMEKIIGDKAKEFDPEAFTDSQRGPKVATITDPETIKILKARGVKSVKLEPSKTNPKTQTEEFIIFNYGQNLKQILDEVDQGRFYYEKKYPELFKDGELRRDIFNDRHNVAIELTALDKEAKKLEPIQLGKIRDRLQKEGYETSEITTVINDISKGNINLDRAKRRISRAFVGSLNKRKDLKIGVNLDPINARRKQNLQLSKKLNRDNLNIEIYHQLEELDRIKTAYAGKLTDEQLWKLNREISTVNSFSDMVNNRPSPVEKIILDGVANATKKDANWIFSQTRDVMDNFLGVQAPLKLAMNVSGSMMNILEAFRVTAADTAFDFAIQDWGELIKRTHNPLKLIADTRKKMAKSKKYKSMYLEERFDASIDTRFKGKKGIATKVNENGVVKLGMMPFSASIEFGKVYTYNVAELIGKKKGLTGGALDDFIFDFMGERSQIQDLNFAPLAKSNKLLGSALFLKNFIFRMSEFEIDSIRRLAGSVKKGKIDREAAKRVLMFTAVPATLFGVGSSPSIMLLNSIIGGTTGALNEVSGGVVPHVDLINEMQAGTFGSPGSATSKGVAGSLFNISTRQMTIDPVGALGQAPIPISFATNLGKALGDISFHTKTAMEIGDVPMWLNLVSEDIEKYLAKEVTAVGRAKKAKKVLTEGTLSSVSGLPIETDIPPDERTLRAISAVSGFNTASADEKYARLGLFYKKSKAHQKMRELYADTAAKLVNEGEKKRAKKLIRKAADNGYEVSDKMIENRLKKMKQTRVQRVLDTADKREQRIIQEQIPGLLED